MISQLAVFSASHWIDVIALLFGIGALTLIFIFYRSRNTSSVVGIALITAVLLMVIGAIYYSPRYGYPLFGKIKVGELEVVINGVNAAIKQLDCEPQKYDLCEICAKFPKDWPTCDAFESFKHTWDTEHVSKLTPQAFFRYIYLTRDIFIKSIANDPIFINKQIDTTQLKINLIKFVLMEDILNEEFKNIYCPCN